MAVPVRGRRRLQRVHSFGAFRAREDAQRVYCGWRPYSRRSPKGTRKMAVPAWVRRSGDQCRYEVVLEEATPVVDALYKEVTGSWRC